MNTGQHIQEELQSMGSILAAMPRTMPYAVPAGYFDNIAQEVTNTIYMLHEADVTPSFTRSLPYSVPTSYFKGLTDQLVAKATAAEIKGNTPFTTPAGYFDALPAQMLAAAKATDKKTHRILPTPGLRKWLAAAIVVLGISMGSFRMYFGMQQKSVPEKILSSVPKNDIQDYLQHIYRVDMNIVVDNYSINKMKLDNKDIIQYLDETGWD